MPEYDDHDIRGDCQLRRKPKDGHEPVLAEPVVNPYTLVGERPALRWRRVCRWCGSSWKLDETAE